MSGWLLYNPNNLKVTSSRLRVSYFRVVTFRTNLQVASSRLGVYYFRVVVFSTNVKVASSVPNLFTLHLTFLLYRVYFTLPNNHQPHNYYKVCIQLTLQTLGAGNPTDCTTNRNWNIPVQPANQPTQQTNRYSHQSTSRLQLNVQLSSHLTTGILPNGNRQPLLQHHTHPPQMQQVRKPTSIAQTDLHNTSCATVVATH